MSQHTTEPSPPGQDRRVRVLLALPFVGGGAALLLHIIGEVSFRWMVLTYLALLVVGLPLLIRLLPAERRAWLLERLRIGAIAGVTATAAYDLAKFLLGQLESKPINPFEAINAFSQLMTGSDEGAALLAGIAYHVLNGITFGVFFVVLAKKPTVWKGILWGLCLELFQITLYPGWLDIRAFEEFARISFLGHVVYGAVLGGVARQLQRGTDPMRDQVPS